MPGKGVGLREPDRIPDTSWAADVCSHNRTGLAAGSIYRETTKEHPLFLTLCINIVLIHDVFLYIIMRFKPDCFYRLRFFPA